MTNRFKRKRKYHT